MVGVLVWQAVTRCIAIGFFDFTLSCEMTRGAATTTLSSPMPPSKRTKRSMDSLASSGAVSSPQSSPSASAAPVSKKRVVKLAKDADEVLAQCHKLRDELRRKQMKRQSMEAGIKSNSDVSSDDGEWDMSSDDDKKKQKKDASLKTDVTTNTKSKTKTQQLSLAELNSKRSASGDNDDGKQTIVEVVEMNSTEVMEGIENVAIKIAQQVLNKQGFQLDIPCELHLL